MWLFKKKSKADKAIAVMDDATNLVAERWKYFSQTLAFKDDVGLKEQVAMFSAPMIAGLRNAFPSLRDSPDDALFLYILVGVEKSRTHSTGAVAKAFNIPFPLD